MMFAQNILAFVLIVRCYTHYGSCQEIKVEEDISTEPPTSDKTFLKEILNDVAFFVRSYKFNEWDRRYHKDKPKDAALYKLFPIPPLRTLNLQIAENCEENVIKCLTFLHDVVKTSPHTRAENIAYVKTDNRTLKNILKKECDVSFKQSLKGEPFDSGLEKFQWVTTAAYYMCWYTMNEAPELLNFVETDCCNHANCHESIKDVRAVDSVPFACAMYSFCPDVCCPLDTVNDLIKCKAVNPCKNENNSSVCQFERADNQDLRAIIQNKWNYTCQCIEDGFKWSSKFGMCIDHNECEDKNNCNSENEDCINLMGGHDCICRFGFYRDAGTGICMKNDFGWEEDEAKLQKEDIYKISTLVYMFKKFKQFVENIFKNDS